MRALPLLVLAAAALPAAAHHSGSEWGSIYRERYLLCGDHDAATHLACVGPSKGKRVVDASIQNLGDLGPGKNHDAEIDRARDAIILAIYANDTTVIPMLRAMLPKAPDARDKNEHSWMDKQKMRAEAADGLAHLGDHDSAAAIEQLVHDLETDGYGTLWEDTLAALAVLDPPRASRYAIHFVEHEHDFRTSLPGGTSKLRALDFIRADDAAEALPVFVKLAKAEDNGYDFAYCHFQSMRAWLDPKFHAEVRAMFEGHYSGSWLAGCDNVVMKRFGTEPADAAALERHLGRDDAGLDFGMANTSYDAILDMLVAGHVDAKARDLLRKGLATHATYPHIADPTSDRYSLHFVALNDAALAGLGDATAQAALYAIVDDPKDTSGTAWIAAYWALRLGLPDAADHAGGLVRRGVTYTNDTRNGLFEDIRVKVLDAFADRAPDDARWTVALLDHEGFGTMRWPDASERAYYRLSRGAPRGTCAAVTEAAHDARPAAVESALLALTVLGDRCLPEIEALADDGRASAEVRGAALEIVAVLEAPSLCAHLDRARRDKVWQPAIDRAVVLHGARCGASKKPSPQRIPDGDRPLPPRVFHQGQ